MGQGYHFWQTGGEVSHFDLLPVFLAAGKNKIKIKKKLLGLGHCLLAASEAIRLRKVRNKGFYFIPFASLLASGFVLQSLRGSLMLCQDHMQGVKRPDFKLLHDLEVVPLPTRQTVTSTPRTGKINCFAGSGG